MAELFSRETIDSVTSFAQQAAESATIDAATLGSSFLNTVEIRTTLNPSEPIVWRPLARTIQPDGREVVQLPSVLSPLGALQPQIAIRDASGRVVASFAPGGPLTKNYKPYALSVGALGVAGVTWLIGAKTFSRYSLYAAAGLAAMGWLGNRGGAS